MTQKTEQIEADVLGVLNEVEEEKRKERRKQVAVYNHVRRFLLFVMVCIFCYCVYSLAEVYLDYQRSNNTYKEISNMFYVDVPKAEQQTDESGATIQAGSISGSQEWVWNFEAMKKMNEDAIGWISLPGTQLNYPILQGVDNDEYLHTTVTGEYALAGAIFADYRNSLALEGNYSILYGHNMNNGSMFGVLRKMKEQAFQEEHPVFDVYIGEQHYRYYVYSLYIVEPYETADSPYQFQYEVLDSEEKEKEYEAFLQSTIDRSMYKVQTYTKEITVDDKILTLSTCSGSGENKKRMIVHLVRGEEVID
ncbi:MAG: class B sortase [Lachnospiraceae bacterium]|nr:class B sortase [Lachnospiraceae bacterium]